MNDRELFNRIMGHESFDRVPLLWWQPWTETMERWVSEGYPERRDPHKYFGTREFWINVEFETGLCPAFDEEIFEDTAEYRVFRDAEGVMQKQWRARAAR